MASVINAYSVSLGLDASAFIDGAKVSRSEMRQLTRDIEAARTPAERFAVEQNRLEKAYQSGAIQLDVYQRLLGEARHKHFGAAEAAKKHADEQARLAAQQDQLRVAAEKQRDTIRGLTLAFSAVTVGVTAAAAGGVKFVQFIRDVQNEVDDAADKAQRLGVRFNDLKSLEFGFARGGGVDPAAVGESLKKFQVAIAKAVDGDQGLRDSFAKLGLDAGELMAMGPTKAIMKVADGMERTANHGERLRLAMELFGKGGADLASTLAGGSEELRASVEYAEKWLSLTERQLSMVAANNDKWEDIDIVVTGISQKLAAEMAPAMQIIAEEALGIAKGWENVDRYIKNSVSNGVIMAGLAKDIAEYLASVGGSIVTGGMTGVDRNFTTGLDWYKKLEQNRADAARDIRKKTEDEVTKNRLEAEDKIAQNQAQSMSDYEKAWFRIAEQEEAVRSARVVDRKLQEERKLELRNESPQARGVGTSQAADFIAQWQNGQANAEAKRHAELIAKQNAQLEATRETNRKLDEIATVQPRNRR